MDKRRRRRNGTEFSNLFNRVTYKGGNKKRIQESQKGIFLKNILCEVCERVKKLQNENKQANISSMQTTGEKNRSAMDNLITMSAIIENKDKTIRIFIYCMQMQKNALTNSV